MKKVISSLGIVVLSVSLFFACGGGKDNGGNNEATGSVKGIVLMESASSGTSRIAFAPPDWAPAYGARVKLECKDKKAGIEPCEHESETKEDGSFEINDVVPGEYNLTAETILEDGTKKKSFDEIEVEANKVKDIGEVQIKDVGVLYGLVKLSDGGDPLGTSCFVPGTTMISMAESSGAYGINDVAEGDYSVSCCKANYKCKTVGGVSVLAGQATMVSDITLEREEVSTPLGIVGGVITDSDSGNPLSGVVVTAEPVAENESPQTTQTNSNGEYSLSLAPGDYLLIISRDSYKGKQVDITVVENETQALDFALSLQAGVQMGKISGTVKDQAGAAIASAVVVTNPATESKFTDNSGHFQILNVPPGNYTVTASKGGYLSKSVSISLASGQEVTVSITLDPACADADGDGYTASSCGGLDCNDSDNSINPGVTESTSLCNGKDDDCDGTVDEGCVCTSGATKQCGATDAGECTYGTQNCTNGAWAACVGSVEPVAEVCSDSKDNDCDGKTDSTDEDCFACTPGSTRQCGSTDVGECSYGTQTCVSGFWGSCVGSVEPVTEVCSDSKDNDCDGTPDDGCEPPAEQGLVAFWKFDETSGDVLDSSGKGHNGTVYGNPQRALTGHIGQSIGFDGVDDQVQIPVDTELSIIGNLSISFWINRAGATSSVFAPIIRWNISGESNSGWATYLDTYGPDEAVSFVIPKQDAPGIISGPSTVLNEWEHYVVTYDGVTMKLYKNGQLFSSLACANGIRASGADHYQIGLNPGYGKINAKLDELKVFNTILSDSDVQNEYNLGYGTELFLSNFDDGTLQSWGTRDNSGISTEQYKSANYSIKVNDTVNGGDMAECYRIFSPATSLGRLEFWAYVLSGNSAGTTISLTDQNSWQKYPNHRFLININEVTGSIKYYNGSQYNDFPTPALISFNQWHKFSIYWDSSNNEFKLEINGIDYGKGYPWNTGGSIQQIIFMSGSWSGVGIYSFFDDVRVSSQ